MKNIGIIEKPVKGNGHKPKWYFERTIRGALVGDTIIDIPKGFKSTVEKERDGKKMKVVIMLRKVV